MAMRRQKVPSFIFYAADSSSSLASMVTLHTLDTMDDIRPTMRGVARSFGKVDADKTLPSNSPRIPQRKTSMDMNFRRVPSSFDMDRQGSMLNATFDLNSSLFQASKDDEPSSLFDRFGGCLETIPSPPENIQSPSSTSTQTRKSSLTSDTPLALPRRKPSQQSCMLSPSPTYSKQHQYNILSGLKNATFDDFLMDNTTNCQQRRRKAAAGKARTTRISNTTL